MPGSCRYSIRMRKYRRRGTSSTPYTAARDTKKVKQGPIEEVKVEIFHEVQHRFQVIMKLYTINDLERCSYLEEGDQHFYFSLQ
jgi:hypothetical protein